MNKTQQRKLIRETIHDYSYHDNLRSETVFWKPGIAYIKKRLEEKLGFAPGHAISEDRCGEVLSMGWRGFQQ